MSDRILTKEATAALLTVSVRTLERMEKAGRLPQRIQLSDKRYGYRESDIAAYIRDFGVTISGVTPRVTKSVA